MSNLKRRSLAKCATFWLFISTMVRNLWENFLRQLFKDTRGPMKKFQFLEFRGSAFPILGLSTTYVPILSEKKRFWVFLGKKSAKLSSFDDFFLRILLKMSHFKTKFLDDTWYGNQKEGDQTCIIYRAGILINGLVRKSKFWKKCEIFFIFQLITIMRL